jgi:hypothetical protein
MSEPTKTKRPVPEGRSRFLTTRQKAPNEKGYVGYERSNTPHPRSRKSDGHANLTGRGHVLHQQDLPDSMVRFRVMANTWEGCP